MIEPSPGDVRDVSLVDDLKRIRLSHRAESLERVIVALRAEYEQRSTEKLPPMGLKLALDEFIDELAEVRLVLSTLPAPREEHRVFTRARSQPPTQVAVS